MKIKFVITHNNPRHTHFTVFEDGANCGDLCMESPGFYMLVSILQEVDKEYFEFEVT